VELMRTNWALIIVFGSILALGIYLLAISVWFARISGDWIYAVVAAGGVLFFVRLLFANLRVSTDDKPPIR
jgi:hypothetical protein